MKILGLLLIATLFVSFCPSTEKAENNVRPGYYIFVEDFTDRSYHKYIVESKDSVDKIFDHFLGTELELGNVNNPISINNQKRSFYVARVNIFETPDGKKKFRNLKYENVYIKRPKLKPVFF